MVNKLAKHQHVCIDIVRQEAFMVTEHQEVKVKNSHEKYIKWKFVSLSTLRSAKYIKALKEVFYVCVPKNIAKPGLCNAPFPLHGTYFTQLFLFFFPDSTVKA